MSGTTDSFALYTNEISLIESRIIHIESIQFKLRQFCIAIWTLLISIGLGSISAFPEDWRLVALSIFVILSFYYMDTWYACLAQRFRLRRIEISDYLTQVESGKPILRKPYLYDMTAANFRKRNAIARYRQSFTTKSTRVVRLTFFTPQIIVSSAILINSYLKATMSPFYLMFILVPILLLAGMYVVREINRRKAVKSGTNIHYSDFKGHQEDVFDIQ